MLCFHFLAYTSEIEPYKKRCVNFYRDCRICFVFDVLYF